MLRQIAGKTIELLQGDITRQASDAIVNAANAGLRGGGGVDGAIHRAGGPEIMAECRRIGGCPTGSACVTGAGRIQARFVIHAVGPIWRGGAEAEAELLAGAYRSSLAAAAERQLTTISFPSISTGAYGFPLAPAAEIALATVSEHLRGDTSLARVTFMLFDQRTYAAYAAALERL